MNNTLVDFLSIGIVGIVVSLVVEFIKSKWGSDTFASRTVVISLSIVLGLIYYFVRQTSWWLPIVGILGAASTFYGLFIAKQPSVPAEDTQ